MRPGGDDGCRGRAAATWSSCGVPHRSRARSSRWVGFERVEEQGGREGAGLLPSRGASVASDGTFQILLPEGRYRPVIHHFVGGGGRLPIDCEVVVAKGRTTEHHLHLHSRPVRARVLRRDRPLRGARIRVVVEGRFHLDFAATDDHGWAEFAMPIGHHQILTLGTGEGGTGNDGLPLGSLAVHAGEGPHIVVLHVPDGFGR